MAPSAGDDALPVLAEAAEASEPVLVARQLRERAPAVAHRVARAQTLLRVAGDGGGAGCERQGAGGSGVGAERRGARGRRDARRGGRLRWARAQPQYRLAGGQRRRRGRHLQRRRRVGVPRAPRQQGVPGRDLATSGSSRRCGLAASSRRLPGRVLSLRGQRAERCAWAGGRRGPRKGPAREQAAKGSHWPLESVGLAEVGGVGISAQGDPCP